MWITEVLQKLIPHFSVEKSNEELLSMARLRAIKVELFKLERISPNQVLRYSDSVFVGHLCELKIELDSLVSKGLTNHQEIYVSQLSDVLNKVMSEDITFLQASDLNLGLDNIINLNSEQIKRTKIKYFRLRTLTLLISLGPVLGYGLHWSIANYYQQAILEEVDIVYPENSYEFKGDVFRTRPIILDESIKDFQKYFFDMPSYFDPNPLPLAYDVKEVESLGVKINPESNFAKRIKSGYISDKELSNSGFIMFRAFIRNIYTNNIVNHLRVEVEKISENTFPWKSMDIESSLELSKTKQPLSLWVSSDNAPVLTVDLTMSLNSKDNRSLLKSQHSIKVIQESKVVFPKFSNRVISYYSEKPKLVFVEEALKERLNLEPKSNKTSDRVKLEPDYDRIINRHLMDNDYAYFLCPDGGVVLYSGLEAMQSLLNSEHAESLMVNYSYELLNGKRKSGEENIILEGSNLVGAEGVSVESTEILSCIGGLVFSLEPDIFEPAAAGPGGWVKKFDAIALALMEKPKNTLPVIAAEKSILFDFELKKDKLKNSSNDVYILQDGEYILFNIYSMNFEGGDYHFSFYFDDEKVGEFTINFLWPQSVKFKPGDEKYFR